MNKTGIENCLNCYWWANNGKGGFICKSNSCKYYEDETEPDFNCSNRKEITHYDEGKYRRLSPQVIEERVRAGYKIVNGKTYQEYPDAKP